MSNLLKINKAYEILNNYNGENPHLINLRNNICVYKKENLTDFNIE